MDEDSYRSRIRYHERETKESSDRSLRLVEDCLRSGAATTSELYRQGETLDRTERRLDDIDQDLTTTQKYIRSMKSVFGGLFSRGGSEKSSKAIEREEEEKKRSAKQYDPQAALARAECLSYDQIGDADDSVEKNLVGISRGLGELKTMAEAMGSELDRQDPQIDRLRNRVDDTGSRIQKQNKDVRKLLY